jgi:hypothetical protein
MYQQIQNGFVDVGRPVFYMRHRKIGNRSLKINVCLPKS